MFRNKLMLFHNLKIGQSERFGRVMAQLLVLGAFSLMYAGCSSNNKSQSQTPTPTPILDASLIDRSLLTDQPCPAPCWYGLELGKSTKINVHATLKDLTFIDSSTIKESKSGFYDPKTEKTLPSTLISADCKAPPSRCVGLEIVNDKLGGISLIPNYPLSLSEVVKHLDPPDFVRGGVLQDGTTCHLFLTWIKRQILMVHEIPDGRSMCESISSGSKLDSHLSIDVIYYELPELLMYESQIGEPWPGFKEP